MSDHPIPIDEALPEIGSLLAPDLARRPLELIVEATGGQLDRFSISQISYRPERRISVVFDTVSTTGSHLPVVLAAGEIPDGAAVLDGPDHRLGAWTAWHDPGLPGLPLALDEPSRRELLRPLGVPDVATAARVRSYRPGKRAVVEVLGEGVRLFLKTIRPRDVAALQEAHTALAGRLTIPRSLGWSPDAGIVVLEPLTGKPLSTAPDQAPDPSVVLGLLDRIPPLERAVTSRRRRLVSHLRLLRRIAPALEGRYERIEGAAEGLTDVGPVPVHGDFHSGQILVSNGSLSGLVDIDTVGMGQRPDDHANLLAHLHVMALRDPTGSAARYGERVFRAAIAESDSEDLRIRTAATMLGYASGPWSRQEPAWQNRVERLVQSAVQWLDPTG